jgi:hypothetical protein
MLRTTILVALAIAGGPAFSQICSVPPAQGLEGIGDGCTTYSAEVVFPNVGVFKSTFTPACNNHDACYTQLGADYHQCDSRFYEEMRSACDSKFNQWLRPAEWAACRSTAYDYYFAVGQWGASPSKQRNMQNNAYTRSLALQQSVEADTCGTTPERSGLYASGLISQVNGAFAASAGRSPTLYEFLSAANSGDRLGDPNGWYANVVAWSQWGAAHPPPAVGWYKVSTGDYGVTFFANPVSPNTSYLWRLSQGSGSGTSLPFSYWPPMFNQTVSFKGFIKATNSAGTKNMALVETSIVLPGTCAPNNGPWVNCQ